MSPRIAAWLFGAYRRRHEVMGAQMYFWTRRGAERYGTRGLNAIDPYARGLSREVTFRPGVLLRRRAKT